MNEYELFLTCILVPYIVKKDKYLLNPGVCFFPGKECSKINSKLCQNHYDSLKNKQNNILIRCPSGLYSYKCQIGEHSFVFSGLRGKDSEPRYRNAESIMLNMLSHIKDMEKNISEKYTLALHEIIKLNGIIVADSERMQMPRNGVSDEIKNKAVRIFKTSSVMSTQFRIIDYLSNDTFMLLKVDKSRELYKIFDMFAKVYESREQQRSIIVEQTEENFRRKILCCDETFPIIAGALIQNAIKYSIKNSPVKILISADNGYCYVDVSNQSNYGTRFNDEVFGKGVRLRNDVSGSGMGLYLVKKIVEQHQASLTYQFNDIEDKYTMVTFRLKIKEMA